MSGVSALLTADEVMAEMEEVASPVVAKVLRDAYAGNGRWPSDKGKIADIVVRDLGLEPVTMYRRKVPKDEAPIRVKKRAEAGQ